MADTEEYFPRGGKKPTTTYFKQSTNFLGAPEKGEKKRKRPKKRAEGDDGYLSDEGTKEIDLAFRHCAYGLSYKTVKEGLLILGRVKDILDTKIVISLPCRLIGAVMACHISEPYNKLLEEYVNDKTDKVLELEKMFRVGQYVAVKVLEVKGVSVMLSLMPQHVNGQKTEADLQKGTLLQAAVASVEDHGYVMDIGVDNTRAFLPKTNTNPDIELDVGMVCWCSVKSTSAGVVSLSGELAALRASWGRAGAPLLPGAALDFYVDTPLDNGIEGHVFNDTTAYIQRQHADLVKGKKPNLGQKIRARLLYVMPTRNTPFLSMKDIFASTYPDLREEQTLPDGAIVDDAQVLKITGRSIHFRLGAAGGCYGTMSLKRIQVDEDLTDEEVVAKSYPVGSRHKVRVLCYNLSDGVYSVSDEAGVLRERYFSAAELRAGQLVPATVQAVRDQHLLLAVGRLTGYVPQTHMTDTGIVEQTKKTSSKLAKKFKVGQAVSARVLSACPRALVLTLKPALLAPELPLLASYADAVVGQAYTGVIKTIRDYVLVSFFNDVIAYVPRHYVTRTPLEDLAQAFHHGQIVKCTILRVDVEAKKMSGSLTTPPFWPAPKRKLKQEKKTDDATDKSNENKEIKDLNTEESSAESENSKHTKQSNETDPEEQEQLVGKKKKKNKKVSQDTDEEKVVTQEESESKDKKKDRKRKAKEETKSSEESDAIETDMEPADSVSERHAALLELGGCDGVKRCRRRVLALLRAANAGTRRLARLDHKLARLEAKGLDAHNKPLHTAIFAEKFLVQDRITKLMETMQIVQEKLKELGYQPEPSKELRKKQKAAKGDVAEDAEGSKLEVKVVESLEPALDAPSAKDFWSARAEPAAEPAATSSDDEEEDQPKKKRKKLSVAEKVAKAREEEERLREMERRAIESESQPRSSEQFERALLASPNCSQLWIAYMAFHLQATDIEKARSVGRRALATISFKEELDRLNVWVTLINLETRFGTKETQQKTLEEALQMNDPYEIHCKLLDIYVECGRAQELAALVELMLRRYRRAGLHARAAAACYRLGLLDKARQVMQKAIATLDKKEHVDVLVQFALLERDAGERERAEALFERVLGVYPRRSDAAAAYLHMLHKAGDTARLRQVMERLTSQKLPARTMKILYKKWLEVEEKIGDQAQLELIRQRALQYVEKAKF